MHKSRKPNCLEPCGDHGKTEPSSLFIPDAIVIACDYSEPISPRSEICVECLMSRRCFLPIMIPPFQRVAESYARGFTKLDVV